MVTSCMITVNAHAADIRLKMRICSCQFQTGIWSSERHGLGFWEFISKKSIWAKSADCIYRCLCKFLFEVHGHNDKLDNDDNILESIHNKKLIAAQTYDKAEIYASCSRLSINDKKHNFVTYTLLFERVPCMDTQTCCHQLLEINE